MREHSRKKRPTDVNELAANIVRELTGESPAPVENPTPEKNPHAQALGKLGGKKGGPARAAKLTPEQRRESARKAARARWSRFASTELPD